MTFDTITSVPSEVTVGVSMAVGGGVDLGGEIGEVLLAGASVGLSSEFTLTVETTLNTNDFLSSSFVNKSTFAEGVFEYFLQTDTKLLFGLTGFLDPSPRRPQRRSAPEWQ